MENSRRKTIKFLDVKQQIINQLNSRDIGIDEPVSLVDGFVNHPINMEVSGNLIIGGPTIQMIILIGKNSGRLYFFALEDLLKNKG